MAKDSGSVPPDARHEVYIVKHTKVGSVSTGGEFLEGEIYAPTIDVDLERLIRLGAIEPYISAPEAPRVAREV